MGSAPLEPPLFTEQSSIVSSTKHSQLTQQLNIISKDETSPVASANLLCNSLTVAVWLG